MRAAKSKGARPRLQVTGAVQFSSGGKEIVDFGSRKARSILVFLSASPRPLFRSQLCATLWPEDPEEVARPRLRSELHRLKCALGDEGALLLVSRDEVTLDRGGLEIDIDAFRRLLRQAGQAASNERAELLERACDAVANDFAPSEPGSRFDAERGHFQDELVRALSDLSRLEAAAGMGAEAVAHARRAVEVADTNALANQALLEALASARRLPEALLTYRTYCERMKERFGLGPDPRVREAVLALRPTDISPDPPPSAVRSFPQLRASSFPLHGREAELHALREHVERALEGGARLITILGPGGVGKTALMREAIRRIHPLLDGRAAFVSLENAKTATDLADAILDALGAPPSPSKALDRLSALLGTVPVVLGLDNFEQLVPEGSKWMETALRRLPNLVALVTSRESLHMEEEQRFTLEALATRVSTSEDGLAPSVAVFVDRARRVNAHFAPGPDEVEEIAQLAERLDGMPLALVLAAGRTHVINARAMLAELETGLGWLSDVKELAPRHRKLSATIAYSVDRLPPETRAFLGNLTIFSGSWTLEAAQQVLGPGALESLTQLVDRSLVMRRDTQTGPRFSMLQTIREWLRESEPAPTQATYERLVGWAYDLVRRADPNEKTEPKVFRELIDPEAKTLNVVLDWLCEHDPVRCLDLAVSLVWYWYKQGAIRRGLERLEAAIEANPGRQDALIGRAYHWSAIMLVYFGRYDEAERFAQRALLIFEDEADPVELAKVYRAFAHITYYRAEFGAMSDWCRRGIAAAESAGDLGGLANALTNLSLSLCNLDKGDEAVTVMRRCMGILEELGQMDRLRWSKLNLGVNYLSMQRWDEARNWLTEALDEAIAAEEVLLQSHSLLHLTTVHLRTGNLDKARESLAASIATLPEENHLFIRGVRAYLGTLIALAFKETEEASKLALITISCWQNEASDLSLLPALELAALVLAQHGDLVTARRLLDGCQAVRTRRHLIDSPHYRVTLNDARALTAAQPPDPKPLDDAIALASIAYESLSKLKRRPLKS